MKRLEKTPAQYRSRHAAPKKRTVLGTIRLALRNICKITARNTFRFDLLWFSGAVCWMELVFKLATARTAFGANLLLILLFSVSAAAVLALCATLLGERAGRILKTVLLILLMIPYGVEFFIFQEYNIFYDLNTIRNGAGGAATGFLGEIARLVFSFSGIGMILLLAVPAVCYLIFGRRLDPARRMTAFQRICAIFVAVVCFALGAGIARRSSYAPFYDKEYSFPAAINHFGLLTGMRLDLTRGGSDSVEFEFAPTEAEFVSVETEPPATTAQPDENETGTETTATTFGKHELDIDFAARADQEYGVYASLSSYVASQPIASENEYTGLFKGKNIVFITAEAFSKEAIREDLTPTLWRLWHSGIQMTDYYQPASAGTTGGEFQNIFGFLPMLGGASFPCFTQYGNTQLALSQQLAKQNYWGKAYHNNDFTFYSRHITHNLLGYSEGYIGYGNGMEQYVTYEWPESDADMFAGTIREYIDKPHFQVYYMTVSAHGGYSRYGNAMSNKHWDEVADLDCSDPVKAYYASNIEVEEAVSTLLKALEKKGIADDTVIVLTADHFPYGLDDSASFGHMTYLSELYGYNVTNSIQRDHNAAILWCGCLEDMEPIVVDAPCSSLDLLPTLSNLFGVEYDSRLLPGRDILSDAEAIYFDREYNWKTERGFYLSATQTFYPTTDEEVSDEYVERIKTAVRNKITYCQGVMNSNYFAYLFNE